MDEYVPTSLGMMRRTECAKWWVAFNKKNDYTVADDAPLLPGLGCVFSHLFFSSVVFASLSIWSGRVVEFLSLNVRMCRVCSRTDLVSAPLQFSSYALTGSAEVGVFCIRWGGVVFYPLRLSCYACLLPYSLEPVRARPLVALSSCFLFSNLLRRSCFHRSTRSSDFLIFFAVGIVGL